MGASYSKSSLLVSFSILDFAWSWRLARCWELLDIIVRVEDWIIILNNQTVEYANWTLDIIELLRHRVIFFSLMRLLSRACDVCFAMIAKLEEVDEVDGFGLRASKIWEPRICGFSCIFF